VEFASNLKAVIVPEVNRTGQFAAWVKARTELHLISLNKYGGLPFTPAEIRAQVMEFLASRPAKAARAAEPVEEVAHG
jgi:2-oxoglutarate ferredoxin oxidoreductase subunit alpha